MRQGGDLVALAPLFLWGYGSRPETIRVAFLGAGISDHLGMLAIPDESWMREPQTALTAV